MWIKAVVTYDGTGYGGFQRQKNAPSIQAELEQALERLIGVPTRILASGRTDAGVHAEGQVVAFDSEWRHALADLHRGMNALLPEQIAVLTLEEAEAGFHPRYDARRRRYRYTIYHAPVRNPLVSRFSLHVTQPLNEEAMQVATAMLVGRHDFSAFGSPPNPDKAGTKAVTEPKSLLPEQEFNRSGPKGGNPVRDVYRAEWSFQDPWVAFDIEANAFLYRMVRMLVGTLLRVGYEALTPEAFGEILRTRDRRRAGPAAPARGLCLTAVLYEE